MLRSIPSPITASIPHTIQRAALFVFLVTLVSARVDAAAPGPTVAREDTMSTQVPEVLVRAPRVTLDEILDRVARGEARRDSLINDQKFTATFRLVTGPRKGKGPELLSEIVLGVYKKKPSLVRSVLLRKYERNAKKGGGNIQVKFRGTMDEEIVNFAFRPQARREYKYRIVGRDFVGGHLVYRISFDPKSPLDPTNPSGTVWVDTNEFVIVRQEIYYQRSPVPLFIKDVTRMVIERRKFGDLWVLHRALMRIEATIPIPKIGKQFDFVMRFDDYVMNSGLDDAFFHAEGGR